MDKANNFIFAIQKNMLYGIKMCITLQNTTAKMRNYIIEKIGGEKGKYEMKNLPHKFQDSFF